MFLLIERLKLEAYVLIFTNEIRSLWWLRKKHSFLSGEIKQHIDDKVCIRIRKFVKYDETNWTWLMQKSEQNGNRDCVN